jgi:pimeloyl-ACP methyl ester carboxylesterase
MDAGRREVARRVGNSLGGYVALRLAARGRASSVVAFAPAGRWALGDRSYEDLLLSH